MNGTLRLLTGLGAVLLGCALLAALVLTDGGPRETTAGSTPSPDATAASRHAPEGFAPARTDQDEAADYFRSRLPDGAREVPDGDGSEDRAEHDPVDLSKLFPRPRRTERPDPQIPAAPPPPAPARESDVADGLYLLEVGGRVRMRVERRDGKRHGSYEKFDPQGNLLERGEYVDGAQHGTWLKIGSDGRRTTTTYRLGKKHGLQKAELADGRRAFEGSYQDDRMHGAWSAWHENGYVLAERQFEKGKQNGVTRMFFDDGTLENEYPFVDGKMEGLAKGYHRNGQLEWAIQYVGGVRSGEASWFDSSGRKTAEGHYADGQLHGRFVNYKTDGTVESVEQWDAGRRVVAESE